MGASCAPESVGWQLLFHTSDEGTAPPGVHEPEHPIFWELPCDTYIYIYIYIIQHTLGPVGS